MLIYRQIRSNAALLIGISILYQLCFRGLTLTTCIGGHHLHITSSISSVIHKFLEHMIIAVEKQLHYETRPNSSGFLIIGD